METRVRQVLYYIDSTGRSHAGEWTSQLKDLEGKAAIAARLSRTTRGLFGDCDRYGPIVELRVHVGPGYRIYLGEDGPVLVILLCAGTKSSQKRDFRSARRLWNEYQEAKRTGTCKLRSSSE